MELHNIKDIRIAEYGKLSVYVNLAILVHEFQEEMCMTLHGVKCFVLKKNQKLSKR